MKTDHPRITLLGNNSGRNLGDAAILSSLLETLSQQLPGAEFYVPSIKPGWITRHYGGKYKVRAVNVLPWTASLRLLGLPTALCFAKSDAALICDGIIFGKKLFNPAFNYLITLVFLVPLAKLLRCPLVCYSCGIGPFPSRISRIFARYLLNNCDLIMMRENDSKELAEAIGVTRPIMVTGDAAFINPVSGDDRAQQLAREAGVDLSLPTLGVNITSYLDTWLKKDERVGSREDFIGMLAAGIKRLPELVQQKVQFVVFCTQPMDLGPCERLAVLLEAKVIDNTRYLSHDIQALMRRCTLFLGMRFHSIILASAVGVPVVGLLYAPKVRGFFRQIQSVDYGLELAALTSDTLAQKLATAWRQREELRIQQQTVIEQVRAGAQEAALRLKAFLSAANGGNDR